MLAAFAVAATLAGCIPMRWISADPRSLALLESSAVSCLLLEEEQWGLRQAVQNQGRFALAVARGADQATRAQRQPFDAVVVEGDFPFPVRTPVIPLPPRRALRMEKSLPATGTTEGVWPGIEIEHGGPKEQTAAPTGSAWIHTNTGFLRYATAAAPSVFWMANRPPGETARRRYLQAIADAAMVGARWVVTLDATFAKSLLAGEKEAVEDWAQIERHLRFYKEDSAWSGLKPYAELAIVQDATSGALVTGNLLDMLAVMNTPVKAVPSRELTATRLEGAKVAVALHPGSYTPEQRALIRKFAGGGGKLVTGPEGFRMPEPDADRFTFGKEQYQVLEKIWPELHLAVQRKNFGARLFNVTGTLSYLRRSSDGRKAVLHLVNYSDYPVENITAIVQGKYRRASLLRPGEPPKPVEVYDAPEGTGVEVDSLEVTGAIVLEP